MRSAGRREEHLVIFCLWSPSLRIADAARPGERSPYGCDFLSSFFPPFFFFPPPAFTAPRRGQPSTSSSPPPLQHVCLSLLLSEVEGGSVIFFFFFLPRACWECVIPPLSATQSLSSGPSFDVSPHQLSRPCV